MRNIIREHRKLRLKPRVDIVARFASETEAFAHEIALIAKYGRLNNGTGTLCNLTDGGGGTSGIQLTPRQRRRIIRHLADPQFQAIRLKTLLALARDPKVKARRRANFRKIRADPQFQARNAIRLRKLSKDPKRIANHRKACTTEAFRQKIQDRWGDPEFKKRMGAIHKRNSNKPARRAKQSRVAKRNWQNKKLRKTMTAANRANAQRLWSDPKYRRRMRIERSHKMRGLWRNPKWRAKTLAARRAAQARK